MSTKNLVSVWLVALPLPIEDRRRTEQIAGRLLDDLPQPLQSTVPSVKPIAVWESADVSRDPHTLEPTTRALMCRFVDEIDLTLAEAWPRSKSRATYVLDLEKRSDFEEIVRQVAASCKEGSVVMWMPQGVLASYYNGRFVIEPYMILKATFDPNRISYDGFKSFAVY